MSDTYPSDDRLNDSGEASPDDSEKAADAVAADTFAEGLPDGSGTDDDASDDHQNDVASGG